MPRLLKITEDEELKQFEHFANAPAVWFGKGSSLLRSSERLGGHCNWIVRARKDLGPKTNQNPATSIQALEVHDAVQMLRAMALECLLKGLWLKHGGKLVLGGEYKKIPNTNDHDLLSILRRVAEKTGERFSGREEHLVERLAMHISSGRYPISKHWKPQITKKHPTGAIGPPSYWNFPDDEKAYLSFINRILALWK